MKKYLLFFCTRKIIWSLILISSIFLFSCSKKYELEIINEIQNEKNSPFYIDFDQYPNERQQLPIGVFDSGTGGLTVLNAILSIDAFNNSTKLKNPDNNADFNRESFIYLCDKANMPYGRYDAEGNKDFLRELVIKDVQFLLGEKYYNAPTDPIPPNNKKLPVKAIVIACNTATAFGLEDVKNAIKYWDVNIPVIGIIEAASKHVVKVVPPNGNSVIGVMATEGTCASNGYPDTIMKYAKEALPNANISIVQQPGYGLAGAIDGDPDYINKDAEVCREFPIYRGPALGNKNYPIDLKLMKEYHFITENNALLISKQADDQIVNVEINLIENYTRYHVTNLVLNAMKQNLKGSLDAIVLGCTHYPYVQDEIKNHLMYLRSIDSNYASFINENIQIIDPSFATAFELFTQLEQDNLFTSLTEYDYDFFISVPNPLLQEAQIDQNGNFTYDYKYSRIINQSKEYVKRVPFSQKYIDSETLSRLKINIPDLYLHMFTE